jgi:phosphomethylpyrimidine synthase
MCGPKFCSMEISHQLKEYAEAVGQDVDTAAEQGKADMAQAFREGGSTLYRPS